MEGTSTWGKGNPFLSTPSSCSSRQAHSSRYNRRLYMEVQELLWYVTLRTHWGVSGSESVSDGGCPPPSRNVWANSVHGQDYPCARILLATRYVVATALCYRRVSKTKTRTYELSEAHPGFFTPELECVAELQRRLGTSSFV